MSALAAPLAPMFAGRTLLTHLTPEKMAVADETGNGLPQDENPAPVPMEEEKKELTELEKYWKAVRENPADFTGWTYLLQYVEQENDIVAAREAFDAFLQKYPYCYGYWKKYADLEKKHEDLDLAAKVFERGLEAIALSIDLWLHYIAFTATRLESDPNKETKLRALYEKAITAAGTDFLSDKLWDKYLSWEKEEKNLKNVTTLYDRLLAIPTQLYSHHFENFSEHVKTNHPKDIVTLDEFLRLRKEAAVAKPAPLNETTGEEDEETADTNTTEPPPGTDLPPGSEAPPGFEAPPGADTQGDEEEVKAVREKIIEERQVTHKKTEEEVSRRWGYEEGIRRPYFHVKPLERAQLKNWKEYIDFEIENGSHERVVVLFERCMVACALYEEFWIKYAKYLEPHSATCARKVYERACNVHLPKKPTLHLSWAAFEEGQNNNDKALEIVEQLEKNLSGLVMVSMRRISLLRRKGRHKELNQLFQDYIDMADSGDVKSFFAIKYARFLNKVMDDHDGAKDVLEGVLKVDKSNIKVHLQLIDLEYQQKPINEQAIIEVFDRAVNSDLALEHRVAFSQRKLEYLEDLGHNVSILTETYDSHQKLMKDLQATKKRKATDSGDDNTTKKAKTENGSNGSGENSPVVTANTLQQQTSQQQNYQPHSGGGGGHHQGGHMDPHQYNYGGNPWGGYHQGYHGYHHGWNYGYGYGGQ